MASRKDSRLNGINPLSYIGSNAYSPPNLTTDDRPPTSNDRKNLDIGALWIDRSGNPDVWILTKFEGAVSTWLKIGEGTGTADEFPTDSGTAIPVDGDLNIFGDGDNISTAGAGNTVTISLSGDVADVYQTDINFAVPVAGTLEIAGGTSVTTTGAGNVVTIDIDADIATLYVADVGSAIPAFNTLGILGGANVTTNAAGAAIVITATGGGGGGSANASFLAYQPTNGGDVSTPAGGVYLGDTVIMTEVYDIGGNFTPGDGAGVAAKFTAPQDGKYLLTFTSSVHDSAPSSATDADFKYKIETSNRDYQYRQSGGGRLGGLSAGEYIGSFSVVADMDSGDTAEYFILSTFNIVATQLVNGNDGAGVYQTFVSGSLEENDVFGFTEHAVLVGDSTSGIGELPLGTDGQVIIGATGASPLFANITAGANITINEGPNTLEIISTGGGTGSSISSFSAFQPSAGGDATASGGVFLGAAVAMTEIFDVGGDFYPGDGVGTPAQFVAPQTGKYLVQGCAWFESNPTFVIGTHHYLNFETSNRDYWHHYSVQTITTNRYVISIAASLIADMDIGDVLQYHAISAGPPTTIINGQPVQIETFVTGTLV